MVVAPLNGMLAARQLKKKPVKNRGMCLISDPTLSMISLDPLCFGGVVKKARFVCKNIKNVNVSSFESALATSVRHGKVEFQKRKGFPFTELCFCLAPVFIHMEAMQCLSTCDESGALCF